jgi:large subunit ribosomal protein L22
MEVKATAKYVPGSPRKLRLIADSVKGQPVADALAVLRYYPSPLSKLIAKVVKSAAANAENNYQLDARELRIVNCQVDEGPTAKRFRARSRGQASPILHRTSHITVAVAERDNG